MNSIKTEWKIGKIFNECLLSILGRILVNSFNKDDFM